MSGDRRCVSLLRDILMFNATNFDTSSFCTELCMQFNPCRSAGRVRAVIVDGVGRDFLGWYFSRTSHGTPTLSGPMRSVGVLFGPSRELVVVSTGLTLDPVLNLGNHHFSFCLCSLPEQPARAELKEALHNKATRCTRRLGHKPGQKRKSPS